MSDNNGAKGIGFFAILALLAGRSCRSCDSFGEDFLRSISKNIDAYTPPNPGRPFSPEFPSGGGLNSGDFALENGPIKAKKVGLKKNPDGTYVFRDEIYLRFEDIPFNSSDKIYVNHQLTQDEVNNFIDKGVKFVFNNTSYLQQKDKSFRIIFLISNDVSEVKNMYDLDKFHAEKLIEFAKDIEDKETIIKVSSLDRLIKVQNELLKKDIVPVLIFHNSSQLDGIKGIDSSSNLITCNSFQITPDSYLTSVDLLDLRSVIKAVNDSYSKPTLEHFYEDFATSYQNEILRNQQNSTLLLLSGGLTAGGGVYAIVYYKKK